MKKNSNSQGSDNVPNGENLAGQSIWPDLSLAAWNETYSSLHMWTQIVGKIRLSQAPYVNHWWQVALYVTARGLTTSPVPYGYREFEINFDFLDHRLFINTSDGLVESMALSSCSVAEFYTELMNRLQSIGISVKIWPVPVEVENPIPFLQNQKSLYYNPVYAYNFWQILIQTGRVFQQFRSRFIGKCSPIHFFWGSFDFAMTRFSGRKAPVHQPVPNVSHSVVIEAYSHEVSSCGFWPGGGTILEPIFYSYTYPEPAEYRHYHVQSPHSSYIPEIGEFVLPYNSVRKALDPDRELMNFLQSTYEAAAVTGHWDRSSLEH